MESKLSIENEIYVIMAKYNPTLAQEFLFSTFHKDLNIKAFIGGFNDCSTKELLSKLKEEYDLVKSAIAITTEMIAIREEMKELQESM